MTSLFGMGVNSLMAYQYALTVTGQNISNANAPSYSRREVVFSEAFYRISGQGVDLAGTKRMFDEATTRNLQISNALLSKSDAYYKNLKDFEGLFDENAYSISHYLNESLKALNQISSNPASIQSREQYLFQLQNIVSRFNDIDSNIQTQQTSINKSINTDVNAVNSILSKLSRLNTSIPMASYEEQGELLDQRDGLLSDLSKYIGFESSLDNKGLLSLELSNGSPLLKGTNASSLVTYPSPDSPNQLQIGIAGSNSTTNITSLITSGELSGLLNYQNTVLDDTENTLGRLALVISQQFNQQNRLGIDLNGNLGGDLFNNINSPSAMQRRVEKNTNNAGSADLFIQINDATQLTTSDYLLEFGVNNSYTITRKYDNQRVSTGTINAFPSSIDIDGFSLKVNNGNFSAGDKYVLSPTKNAAKDIGISNLNASGLALGLPVVTSSATQNTGKGVISLSSVLDTSNAAFALPGQLNPPIRIEFTSSNTYRLVNTIDSSVIEDNIVYDPIAGADVFPTGGGFDPGYRVNLTGNMQAGDLFNIDYNIDGAGDNRNGLLLAQMYQKGILENGSLTFTEAYQVLSNVLSIKVNLADQANNANKIINSQAESRRDQLSGVSLQEETINLAKYQQAYEACAQIIEAGRKVFDTVIGLSRGS